MTLTRREFLMGCSSAIAALAGGRITGLVFASPDDTHATNEIFVHIFLRGGCDGLSLVAPVMDANYVANRGTLRVLDTGPNAGLTIGNTLNAMDFRLHPKASGMKELYDSNRLAIVHACGLTNGTRSHFDAMDFMERGTPTNKNTSTGWLTRHLQSSGNTGIFRSMAANAAIPASLLGSLNAVSIPNVATFKINGHYKYGPQQQAALNRLYTGGSVVHDTGAITLDAITAVQSKNPANPYVPDVEYPSESYVAGLTSSLKSVAQMIKLDMGLQIATVDFGGWDTHEAQNNFIANQIDGLSRALHAFYNDLSAYHSRLTVVVMSEFGRRLKANRSDGTDHGHGNVAFVLGNNVNGGRMYGNWPGLATEELDNRVDLAITTDYRTILSEIVVKRLGNPRLGIVFPGMGTYTPLGIIKGQDVPIDWSSKYNVFTPMIKK